MARISASIPEELKDQLYQYATDHDLAISHIVVVALQEYLSGGSSDAPPIGLRRGGIGPEFQQSIATLTTEVRELRQELAGRTPPRNAPRYF